MRKIIIVTGLIGLLCDIIGGALFMVAPAYNSLAFLLALLFILPAIFSGAIAFTLSLIFSLRRTFTRLASAYSPPASDTRERVAGTPFIRFRVVRFQDRRDQVRFIRQRLFLVVILVVLLFILSGFGPLSGGLIRLGQQYVNSVHFGAFVALVLFLLLLPTLLYNIFAGFLEKQPPHD
jgi:hypothetical protein